MSAFGADELRTHRAYLFIDGQLSGHTIILSSSGI